MVDRISGWAQAFGISQADINKALNWAKPLLNGNPAFYMKAYGGVNNGQFDINIPEAQIGKFSIPMNMFSGYKSSAEDFAVARVKTVPGLNLRSVGFKNGELLLDIDSPQVQKFLP